MRRNRATTQMFTVLICIVSLAFEAFATLAEFQGNVVDDETGESVTNFVVQLGTANPQKPEGVTWTQEFHGPVFQRPGFFSLQSIKQGKAWARVLADGYLPQPVTAEPVVSPVRMDGLVVRMKRGGELRGVVSDHAGRAVADARVFLAGTQGLNLTDGKPSWAFKGSTATTDAAGSFRLRGVGGPEQQVIVVSADGLQLWPAPKPEPGQELKITLPKPAVLAVRYDIPDDAPNAEFELRRMMGETIVPVSKSVSSFLKRTVANQTQIVLTNLTPGTYELARTKMLRVGDASHGVFCDRRRLVFESGQTQRVDLVRGTGHPIRGEVVGLNETTAPGAFIYVRSAEATGYTLTMTKEWKLPIFDAVTCDEGGHFSTARIEPGTYTIVAEAFRPEAPSQIYRSGIRRPDYIGTANVTISADTPPAAVRVKFSAR